MNRIYIGGTFDLPHYGHIKLFKRAKELGTVIVSLNRDKFAARYKRKPILTLKERMSLIKELKCVDEVVINIGDEDSRPAIRKARATHILHGDDWKGKSLMRQLRVTAPWLKKHRIALIYVPYTKGISTSKILSRVHD